VLVLVLVLVLELVLVLMMIRIVLRRHWPPGSLGSLPLLLATKAAVLRRNGRHRCGGATGGGIPIPTIATSEHSGRFDEQRRLRRFVLLGGDYCRREA
jgi:hypothetical protein